MPCRQFTGPWCVSETMWPVLVLLSSYFSCTSTRCTQCTQHTRRNIMCCVRAAVCKAGLKAMWTPSLESTAHRDRLCCSANIAPLCCNIISNWPRVSDGNTAPANKVSALWLFAQSLPYLLNYLSSPASHSIFHSSPPFFLCAHSVPILEKTCNELWLFVELIHRQVHLSSDREADSIETVWQSSFPTWVV